MIGYLKLLVMLALTAGSLSHAEKYEKYRGKILVGKEVEVMPEHLVHLFPYFEFPPSITKLSDEEKARYLINQSHNARVRADAPPEVAEVLKSMYWSQDGGALEFRDTQPFNDLDRYVDHTNKFLKLVKMDEIANNPMQHLGKTHMHTHISVPGDDRNQKNVADRMNALALLKFVEGGEGVLALTDTYGYETSLHTKGLLKQVERNHIEIRNHFTSPEVDAADAARLLTQGEDKSIAELDREIKKRMTPEAMKVIATQQAHALTHILGILNRGEQRIPWDSSDVVAAFASAVTERGAGQFPSAIRDLDEITEKDPGAAKLKRAICIELAKLAKEDPFAFYDKFSWNYAALLNHISNSLTPAQKEKYFGNTNWIKPITNRIETLPPNDRRFSAAVQLLAEMSEGFPSAKEAIISLLGNRDVGSETLLALPKILLEDSEIQQKAIETASKLDDASYSSFIHRMAISYEAALPFLRPGIAKGNVRAIMLEQHLRKKAIERGPSWSSRCLSIAERMRRW